MGKRMADRFDDDYFAEPNYDKLSDEELDELYNFGELRSPHKPKVMHKSVKKMNAYNEADDWMNIDLDLDDDNDLYDD